MEEKTFIQYWQKNAWIFCLCVMTAAMGAAIFALSSATSEMIIVGLASLAVGGFFGFMFGVPRVLSDEQYATNLEVIADWLTKLLIGAGLVELGSLRNGLNEFSTKLGGELGVSQYVIFAIVIFGMMIGILFGYLWTQTHFQAIRDQRQD